MISLSTKALRNSLLKNFSTISKPKDDEIVDGMHGEIPPNALLGASTPLAIYSIFYKSNWEDINKVDFFSYIYKDRIDGQKKISYMNENIVFLTEKAWLYYLPGFLWAMVVDIKNIDKLDVLFVLIMDELNANGLQNQQYGHFGKRYKDMSFGKKLRLLSASYILWSIQAKYMQNRKKL